MMNPLKYTRRKSRRVMIGDIPLGDKEIIRIQSMTNTDTSNVEETAGQIIEILDAGADYVRVTVPTSYVAEKIPEIKQRLKARGKEVPLIADIHFSPKAAEVSAAYLEKVRINPGNYIDKKQFKQIEYTEEEYLNELKRIKENIFPLIQICKEHHTAVRIGTNHGSLSDRIMSRYGDTPLGMVESTMEFLRAFKEDDFNDIVISMKASNPLVMIHAVRLLVKSMEDEGMDYPLHLGVTEAGNDIEGRIKSAVGIGALLADGIGDTIRVSLTESPANEIPVAKLIIQTFQEKSLKKYIPANIHVPENYDPYSYKRRATKGRGIIGGENVPVVISSLPGKVDAHSLIKCGFEYDSEKNVYKKTDISSDFIFIGENDVPDFFPEGIKIIQSGDIINSKELNTVRNFSEIKFIEFQAGEINNFSYELLKDAVNSVLILDLTDSLSPVHEGRSFFFNLMHNHLMHPVIFKIRTKKISEKEIIEISAKAGTLMIDGFGDGIWTESTEDDIRRAKDLSFGILQACRARITKTEYISCPSCGRTLFNLEETTTKIKEKTAHLKGIKIGIMGCIVNGPGEMADADFGYVGTGKGKVTLYRKQKVVKRNIPEEDALDELMKLIDQYT